MSTPAPVEPNPDPVFPRRRGGERLAVASVGVALMPILACLTGYLIQVFGGFGSVPLDISLLRLLLTAVWLGCLVLSLAAMVMGRVGQTRAAQYPSRLGIEALAEVGVLIGFGDLLVLLALGGWIVGGWLMVWGPPRS